MIDNQNTDLSFNDIQSLLILSKQRQGINCFLRIRFLPNQDYGVWLLLYIYSITENILILLKVNGILNEVRETFFCIQQA